MPAWLSAEIVTLPKGKPVFSDKICLRFHFLCDGRRGVNSEGECGLDGTTACDTVHCLRLSSPFQRRSLWIIKPTILTKARFQLIAAEAC